MLVFVVDPATPLVPMFTVLVVAFSVAPVPKLLNDVPVLVPKLFVLPEKSLIPVNVWFSESSANVPPNSGRM